MSFADPMVEKAAKNIFVVASKKHEGSFKPQRERDILTAGRVTPSILVVYEASHPKKDGKKDSVKSG